MAGGLISAFTVKREVFPEFDLDIITVTVPYLGAAPEEVEEGVCVRVEEAIQGLDGIKRITSTAAEGMGTVVIELDLGADARKVLDDRITAYNVCYAKLLRAAGNASDLPLAAVP